MGEKMEKERIDELGIEKLKVIQNKDYFCFGMDSVLLANFVESNQKKNVILDFCSGSGVISFIIHGKKKYQKILAVELQKEMFGLLEKNIQRNHLENQILAYQENIKNVKAIRNQMIQQIGKESADIIVCNPPYKTVGTGIQNENIVNYIARYEVECKLEDIFFSASKLLKSRGKLYLVHKPERLVDLLSLARKYQLEAKRIKFVYPTLKKVASIVLIEYVKDGGNEAKVLEPLIEYDNEFHYTDEIYQIYGMNKGEK